MTLPAGASGQSDAVEVYETTEKAQAVSQADASLLYKWPRSVAIVIMTKMNNYVRTDVLLN